MVKMRLERMTLWFWAPSVTYEVIFDGEEDGADATDAAVGPSAASSSTASAPTAHVAEAQESDASQLKQLVGATLIKKVARHQRLAGFGLPPKPPPTGLL